VSFIVMVHGRSLDFTLRFCPTCVSQLLPQ
jgi:hypothetical protein